MCGRPCRRATVAATPLAASSSRPHVALRGASRSAALQRVCASSRDAEGQPPAPQQPEGALQSSGMALGPRDDDILPDSLTGALEDASRATTEAMERGVDRCIVGFVAVWGCLDLSA